MISRDHAEAVGRSKYVVLFLVDAFYYKSVGAQRRGYSPTPFLDQLFKSGTCFTNIFSQAPFTEGAVYGLYSGQNALDGTSYMFNLRDARRTIGEVFRDNGYRTHTNLTSFAHLQGFMRGFDSWVFATSGEPQCIWDNRLSHFAKLHARGELDAADHDTIFDLVTANFAAGQAYLRAIYRESSESAYVQHMISDRAQVIETHDFLTWQEKRFRRDSRRYILELLEQGLEHLLFTNYIVRYDEVPAEFRAYVTQRLKPFIARSVLRSLELQHNQQTPDNAKSEAGHYLLRLVRKRKFRRLAKELGKHVVTHPRARLDVDLVEKFRPWLGVKGGLDYVLGLLKSSAQDRPDQPLFILNHVDGLHIPFRYLSTEIPDKELFDRELETMEMYLQNVEPRSPYLLSYDYTLCYLDEKIREFVEALKQAGLWNDTAFIVTADHGNSFTGATRRKNTVNNFYDENYHVPLAITGGSIPARRIDTIGSSIDTLTTLMSVLGLRPEAIGDGIDLTTQHRDVVTLEHYGSGCPDWRRRGKNIAARSETFKVMYEGGDPRRFDPSDIHEIYDMQADPGETKNIVKSARTSREVLRLVDVMRERHRLASGN